MTAARSSPPTSARSGCSRSPWIGRQQARRRSTCSTSKPPPTSAHEERDDDGQVMHRLVRAQGRGSVVLVNLEKRLDARLERRVEAQPARDVVPAPVRLLAEPVQSASPARPRALLTSSSMVKPCQSARWLRAIQALDRQRVEWRVEQSRETGRTPARRRQAARGGNCSRDGRRVEMSAEPAPVSWPRKMFANNRTENATFTTEVSTTHAAA